MRVVSRKRHSGARNQGNRKAAGVMLSENIPQGTRFEAATGSVGWISTAFGGAGAVCIFSLGTLDVVAA